MFATSVTVCVVCEYVCMWICTQMLRCPHESMHMGKYVSQHDGVFLCVCVCVLHVHVHIKCCDTCLWVCEPAHGGVFL